MAEVIGQTKSAFITANGESIVEPTPSGYGIDALTKVTINTNVEDQHLLVRKTVTKNGEYTAPEGQAFSKVVVDVTAELESIDIVSNGTYEPEEGKDGWNKIIVDVPSDVNNQDKTVTENGIVTADLGYSGLGQVTVDVQPTDEQKEEYRQEGRNEQKAKLTTITVNENGVYTKDDGYSRVTVDVHASEEEKQAERDAQKALDKAAVEALSPVNENGSYSLIGATLVVDVPASEEELAEAKAEQLATDKEVVKAASPINANGTKTILGEDVVVDVPSDPEELEAAKAEGVAEQKAKLTDLTVTANGTYQKEDGYKKVVVDVESGEGFLWWPDATSYILPLANLDSRISKVNPVIMYDSSSTREVRLSLPLTPSDKKNVFSRRPFEIDMPNCYVHAPNGIYYYLDIDKFIRKDGSSNEGYLIFFGDSIEAENVGVNHRFCAKECRIKASGSVYLNADASLQPETACEKAYITIVPSSSTSDVHIINANSLYAVDVTAQVPSQNVLFYFRSIKNITIEGEYITPSFSSCGYVKSDGSVKIKYISGKNIYWTISHLGLFDWSEFISNPIFPDSVNEIDGLPGMTKTVMLYSATALSAQSLTNIANTVGNTSGGQMRINAAQNALLTEEDRQTLLDKGWAITIQ